MSEPDETDKTGPEPAEPAGIGQAGRDQASPSPAAPGRASSEQIHGAQAAQGAVPPTPATPAAPPAPDASPEEEEASLPARLGEERMAEPVTRMGLFGVQDTPDTSGYGLLRVHRAPVLASPRPYGGYFDELADALETALGTGFSDAIERVVADRGELTFYVRRERLPEVAAKFRDDPALRFELCGGVSGVHYPDDAGRELHAVYHLLSITYNRRVRLEVTAPDADPHIPTLVGVYPACNWHERETWDFFGIIFDGHPALTRIQMPDDWKGHPQRKDYPLGGIPVEYRGAKIPAPDERRHYS